MPKVITPIHLVIFDFDGTLGVTYGNGSYEELQEAGENSSLMTCKR